MSEAGDPTRRSTTLNAPYTGILESCQSYLVASSIGAAAKLPPAPDIPKIPAPMRIDPQRVASKIFLERLLRLDNLVYEPLNMKIPSWALYDCAEVPGGVFGFAMPPKQLPPAARDRIEIEPDDPGLVPVSMLVAIPMMQPGAWHLYRLCSIEEAVPGAGAPGLLLLTLVAGLVTLGIRTVYGASPWPSWALAAHTRLAPLELLTAWTPAHTRPDTATWRFEVDPGHIAAVLGGAIPDPGADPRWVGLDNAAAQQELQAELEEGRRYQIVGPPQPEVKPVRLPVREMKT